MMSMLQTSVTDSAIRNFDSARGRLNDALTKQLPLCDNAMCIYLTSGVNPIAPSSNVIRSFMFDGPPPVKALIRDSDQSKQVNNVVKVLALLSLEIGDNIFLDWRQLKDPHFVIRCSACDNADKVISAYDLKLAALQKAEIAEWEATVRTPGIVTQTPHRAGGASDAPGR